MGRTVSLLPCGLATSKMLMLLGVRAAKTELLWLAHLKTSALFRVRKALASSWRIQNQKKKRERKQGLQKEWREGDLLGEGEGVVDANASLRQHGNVSAIVGDAW